MKEGAYKKAGVDIVAAAELVENIKPHVKKTHRSGVMGGIGGFGALFDLKATGLKDPILVSSTDGVGTKIKIAIDTGLHQTIGIDCVAMCVNDLVVQGAEPLFFLDYFACGKLDTHVAEAIIKSVADGCFEAGCALIGGETAEMPGLYEPGDYDLAGFTVGAVERDAIIDGSGVQAGNVVLGIASSGVHSNGYSLVRRLVLQEAGLYYDDPAPFAPGQNLGQALLVPTKIYVKPLLKALKISAADGKPAIRAMAHITGGGLYENIPRVLPEGTLARLNAASWPLLPVFQWLQKIGDLDTRELATTLNCGIGMVVVCEAAQAAQVAQSLQESGEKVYEIGRIEARSAGQEPVIIEGAQAWLAKS